MSSNCFNQNHNFSLNCTKAKNFRYTYFVELEKTTNLSIFENLSIVVKRIFRKGLLALSGVAFHEKKNPLPEKLFIQSTQFYAQLNPG